jgi:hypothetical protein
MRGTSSGLEIGAGFVSRPAVGVVAAALARHIAPTKLASETLTIIFSRNLVMRTPIRWIERALKNSLRSKIP